MTFLKCDTMYVCIDTLTYIWNTASDFISKESVEELHEGSSDAADGHGESSTTSGNFNKAHLQYGEMGLTRGSHIYIHEVIEHRGLSQVIVMRVLHSPTYSMLVLLALVSCLYCLYCVCVRARACVHACMWQCFKSDILQVFYLCSSFRVWGLTYTTSTSSTDIW